MAAAWGVDGPVWERRRRLIAGQCPEIEGPAHHRPLLHLRCVANLSSDQLIVSDESL